MSVIRRKHTKNFTTIGNELFNDTRLSLDEIGLLVWLLSHPHDWEIRRSALMRRHKVGAVKLGRDGLRRIIRNLMITGWCHAEKTRLSNGTFHVEYQIRDEPGPEMTEAEAIEALSLVSSEAVDDQAEETEVDPVPPDIPATPEPGVAGPGVAGRMWTNKSLPNTDSQNTDSTKTAAVWKDVLSAWPASEILSPVACEKLFVALSQKDRQQAFEGIKPYLSRCKERNRKVCDLSTYLKERRFETVAMPTNGILSACKPSTPEAARWIEYYEAIGLNKLSPGQRFALRQLKHGQTTTVPSQWPPPLPAKQSTGPPPFSDLMKPGEEDDLKWG